MKVLIVDDHPHDLQLLRDALQSGGWDVAEACDGVEALDFLEKEKIDAIVSDVLMPNMDGYRFCYEVRHHPKLYQLPFVIYSGTYKSEDDQLLASEMGVDKSMTKQNPLQVLGALQEVMAQRPKHELHPVQPAEQLHLVKSYSESLVQKLEEKNTELARAMEYLRASEKRLRTIIEVEPECVKVVSHDGRLLDINPAGLAMLGADSVEQLRAVSLIDLVVPEYRKAFADLNASVQRSVGGTLVLEVVGLKGERRWLEMAAVPLPDDQGRNMLLSITRDITAQKKAAHRLACFSQLGHKLNSAQTAFEAAQIIVDIADQLFGWDASSLDLYSEEKKEVFPVLTVDILDGKRTLIPDLPTGRSPGPKMQKAIDHGAQLFLREPSPALPEDFRPFGNKLRISASVMYVPIRRTTTVIGLLSIQSYTHHAYNQADLEVFQSIADHCAGALERIHAQQRLSQILATNPTVLYTLEINGESVNPTWTSENVVQLTGYTAAETCQPGWWEKHLHPDEFQQVLGRRHLLFTENHLSDEYQIRQKNGQYRWIHDDKRLTRDANGKPVEIFGSLTDITERKALQQRLRQAQKMEAIGQLAGGVAHDFNNLLTIMGGSVELLLWEEKNLSAESKHYLADIAAAASRATTLTRQLLTFSRQQAMKIQPLDLNQVIAGFTKMLRRILGEDIAVETRFAKTLLPVEADAGMIEQILMNLFVNARDAMPKGGTLVLETKVEDVDSTRVAQHPGARAGQFIALSVQDSGIGIAPEHLTRIFEPFFTTKDVGQGTGLGLATVYGIVEQHKGWIEVASALGRGTTFKILLPVSTAHASAPATPTGEAALFGKEKILLVEDEPGVRELCQHILEHFGYTVFSADSGVSAQKVWAAHHHEIDLLFTDMVMPGGLTGLELAEFLVSKKPSLKVILTSGYSAQLLGTDISAKSFSFLQKPYPPTTVAAMIRASLDQK